jgi:phage-related protein
LKAEISAITYTFSQYGAIAGLKQVAVSIYSTITALIAQAASFLASAGAATILNIALAPLTGILLGISIAAALVVGAIGNLDNATKSAKSGFKEFKQFVLALGEALLGYLVPLFNTTIDVFEMILSPIFAIVDGFMLIIDSIMGAVGAGSEGASMMETFGSVMDVLGSIVAALGPVFDFIGDIIYTSIITPFRIIAAVLGFTVGLFADLVRALINVGKKFKVFETIKSIFTGLKDIVSSVIEFILKQINNLIGALNLIPGIDIGLVGGAAEGGNAGGASGKLGGLKVTETDVKENLESEKEEDSAKSGQAGTSPPNISYEQNVENTANIDAESDEKEQRIKTLVERALKDANTMRRNSAGQGGGT